MENGLKFFLTVDFAQDVTEKYFSFDKKREKKEKSVNEFKRRRLSSAILIMTMMPKSNRGEEIEIESFFLSA